MTSGKETVPGLSSHNAWTNPPCPVGDLVPPALRTSGLAGPVSGLSLWRPPWRDIPGRVRAGRGASRCADGLRGPVTYGTGFSRDLGKPAQDGRKRCPVGHRMRRPTFGRAGRSRGKASQQAPWLGLCGFAFSAAQRGFFSGSGRKDELHQSRTYSNLYTVLHIGHERQDICM